ncbi:MAG: hypothetical protein HZC55_21665 [Verrucomicrobia bacterium]|nr:hypothetical protein [Verrucomicrobiota bacterium]
MSDRLAELRRQRALVQEHLDWLDREIAASAPVPPGPPAASAPPPHPAAAATPVQAVAPASMAPMAGPGAAATGSAPVDPDSILEQYRSAPGSLQSDVRKGCFLYFAAALGLLALGVVALSFLLRKG